MVLPNNTVNTIEKNSITHMEIIRKLVELSIKSDILLTALSLIA